LRGDGYVCVAVSDADEEKAVRRRRLNSFGITYEVYHGSGRHGEVLTERPIPAGGVSVSPSEKRVTLKVNAYAGDKGNKVTVYLPIEGLRLLLDRFDTVEKEKSPLARFQSK
jgi:hypothetical protein